MEETKCYCGPKIDGFKHEVKVIPKEEILANRSNAYEFIDIDKMKNLHVLPTDKPSRLLLSKRGNLQFLKDNASLNTNNHYEGVYQNIYITNDEEIKEGDWALNIEENTIFKPSNDEIYDIKNSEAKYYEFIKKIILTDNKDLIKDGVQAIDDEFLQWFVKNPSCEEVEVKKEYNCPVMNKTYDEPYISYKIIIPKEEPKQHLIDMKNHEDSLWEDEPKQGTMSEAVKKVISDKLGQETLEEVFEIFMETNFSGQLTKGFVLGAMKFGAKWQQERSYSDMQEYAEFCIECDRKEMPLLLVEDWYEHYKK